jgi:hypothetical protein
VLARRPARLEDDDGGERIGRVDYATMDAALKLTPR